MAIDEFANALQKLVDDFVETPTDADKAIGALMDQVSSLERWKEKHNG